jgi:hypothetical protein
VTPEIRGLVAKGVMETQEGRKRYRERFEALLSSVFDVEKIHQRVDVLSAKLRAVFAAEDPALSKAHAEAVAILLGRIAERARNVREQLSQKGASPAAPLEFNADGIGRPSGWHPRKDRGEPSVEERPGEGIAGAALEIGAGQEGVCIASWRARVFLPAGGYRFQGKIKLEGFAPLEGDAEDPAKPSGACLRISGRQPLKKLPENNGEKAPADGWSPFQLEFQVEPDPGEGEGNGVELVCELRAARGKAWFDLGSLEILRLPAAREKDGR